MKIKKGDNVKIISGKDKNKSGRVIKVLTRKNKVMIEGLNVYKKHVRPKKQGEKGETIAVNRPIDVSNAMLICNNCKKAVRTGSRMEGEIRVRFCKKCGAIT